MKILVNHAGKSYWQGKCSKKATVSAYAIYIFHVSVNNGNWQMAHDLPNSPIFPTKIFPCRVVPRGNNIWGRILLTLGSTIYTDYATTTVHNGTSCDAHAST